MIYDNTNVKANLRDLKYLLPNNLDVGFDDLDYTIPIGLSHEWTVGGRLYRALRWVDECKGFSNWTEALEWLANVHPEEKITQIQVWGHGAPGRSWMGKTQVNAKSFQEHGAVLEAIKNRMDSNSVIWFRNCGVFAGNKGQHFAKEWARNMNCVIAAHTYIIGIFQAGLNTLRPGQEPLWSPLEGIEKGTAARPVKLKNSVLGSEKNITLLHSKLPRWALKR